MISVENLGKTVTMKCGEGNLTFKFFMLLFAID
jgi:hypothetical protein